MSGNTTITASFLLSCIAAIGVIYNIVSSRKNDVEGSTKKAVDTATRFTQIDVKLEMMMEQNREIIRSNEKKNDEIVSINHNMSLMNSKIERLFEYKDNFEKRFEKLEGGSYEDSTRVYPKGTDYYKNT